MTCSGKGTVAFPFTLLFLFPSLLHHSAAVALLRSTQGSDISGEEAEHLFTSGPAVFNSLGYQSHLCKAGSHILGSSQGAFVFFRGPHGSSIPSFLAWLKNHLTSLLWAPPPKHTSSISTYMSGFSQSGLPQPKGHLWTRNQQQLLKLFLSWCCLAPKKCTHLSLPNGGSWACQPLNIFFFASLSQAALAALHLPNTVCWKHLYICAQIPKIMSVLHSDEPTGSSAGIQLGSEMPISHGCHNANLPWLL